MQAVILAGGLGTRLRPVTGKIPKVLVTVGGRPFLWHLLELLKSQGITDVVLCIGYLGEQIRASFGDGESLGIMLRYSEEKEGLLGTGGALKQARDLLEDYFLVLNGDTYLPIDYNRLEKSFLSQGKKALMVVYDNSEDTGVKNNLELAGGAIVLRYDKESRNSGLKYVEAGALVLKREALDLIEDRYPVSLEGGLYPALMAQKELAAHDAGQRFYDIGTPERIKTFEQFLRRGAE